MVVGVDHGSSQTIFSGKVNRKYVLHEDELCFMKYFLNKIKLKQDYALLNWSCNILRESKTAFFLWASVVSTELASEDGPVTMIW